MISIRGAFVVFPWHIRGSKLVVIFCASFLLAILTVAALPGAGTWAQAPSEIVEEFDNGMGDWEAIFADPPGSANWSVEKDEGGNAVLHYRGGDSFLKWLKAPVWSDYAVEAKVKFIQLARGRWNSFGFNVRTRGKGSWPDLTCYNGGLLGSDEVTYLGKRVEWNGVLDSGHILTPEEILPNQWYTVRVEVVGDTVTVFLNGQRLNQLKDPNPLPAGYTTITVGPGEYLIDHVTWTPISPVVSISTD